MIPDLSSIIFYCEFVQPLQLKYLISAEIEIIFLYQFCNINAVLQFRCEIIFSSHIYNSKTIILLLFYSHDVGTFVVQLAHDIHLDTDGFQGLKYLPEGVIALRGCSKQYSWIQKWPLCRCSI